MKSLLINSAFRAHRNLFAMRAIIPLAIIVTLVLVALLLPGTALAGAGGASSRCGANC